MLGRCSSTRMKSWSACALEKARLVVLLGRVAAAARSPHRKKTSQGGQVLRITNLTQVHRPSPILSHQSLRLTTPNLSALTLERLLTMQRPLREESSSSTHSCQLDSMLSTLDASSSSTWSIWRLVRTKRRLLPWKRSCSPSSMPRLKTWNC